MVSKKWIIVSVTAILLLFSLGLWLGQLGTHRNKRENIVLKAADDHELSYPTTQALIRMGDLLKEWTGGRITVQVYPSAQLGSERETIEQTRLGAIDINRVNINPLTQIAPGLKLFSLPYLFRDAEHLHMVLDGEIGKKLLDTLEDADLIGLAYYDSGQRSFYNSLRPVSSPEDLEGMRIRVQKAEIMRDMVDALGAVPVRLAFEEVYTALQTGVIQGAENNYPSWITKGHYEVAKYYTENAHVRTPEVILFSKKTWDRLSEADRQLIRRAAERSVPYQRRLWQEKVSACRRKAVEAGCKIITSVDTEAFRAAMSPVYEVHAAGVENYIQEIQSMLPEQD